MQRVFKIKSKENKGAEFVFFIINEYDKKLKIQLVLVTEAYNNCNQEIIEQINYEEKSFTDGILEILKSRVRFHNKKDGEIELEETSWDDATLNSLFLKYPNAFNGIH